MITAMTLMIAVLALSVAALVATLRSVLHDGSARPPRSHRVDPDFLPPSARSSFDRAS
ncbi:hypothetical protein SAMN05216561_10572 [Nocardioides psychrotolerans]|uniref:Uncharacterized protein n=2 Tax=Nocardioides psychrotolerans TaxID=1005945 RepID=A0A1I3FNL5_9ACTN|nr:hypothetical protein SAMN05216561_10572 [Nocardioides psychrotolerans]